MLRKEIEYVNYNGETVKETFYFNLSKSELVMWQSSEDGGLTAKLQAIIDRKDGKSIMKTFHDVIMRAYGEKSDDGRRFMKSDELSKAFSETPAFDVLFQELLSSPESALGFVNQIMPADFNLQNAGD